MPILSNVRRTTRKLRSLRDAAAPRISDTDFSDFVAWPYIDTLFDYTQVVGDGKTLAQVTEASEARVAIIGAGAGGMCAAYELLKCGVVPTVFEASNRVGGRAWSQPFTNDDGTPSDAFAELGSMRVPPSQKTFWLYANMFGLTAVGDFPDPGVVQTRLFYEGNAMDWAPGGEPPGAFGGIAADFGDWLDSFEQDLYPPFQAWQVDPSSNNLQALRTCWQTFVDQYKDMSFFRAVKEAMPNWNTECLNAFGALGVGSGGFGPLYQINMLEMLRILLLQWEDSQQQIQEGMEALPNAFYQTKVDVPGQGSASLESLGAVQFGTQVAGVSYDADTGKPTLSFVDGGSETFDVVIVATTTREMSLLGLTLTAEEGQSAPLQENVQVAIRDLHMTSSSKLFIRTKTKFWLNEDGQPKENFPLTAITDELPRSIYALDYPQTDNGVVLISYTWEDDAIRLQAMPDNERFEMLRDIVYRIMPEWDGQLEPVNNEILNVDWQLEPRYYGAFKLDYPGQEPAMQGAYFQFLDVLDDDVDTGVYLAGDSNSWSGGWTEGALQTGINAATATLKRLGFTLPDNSALTQNANLYDYGTAPALEPCAAGDNSAANTLSPERLAKERSAS